MENENKRPEKISNDDTSSNENKISEEIASDETSKEKKITESNSNQFKSRIPLEALQSSLEKLRQQINQLIIGQEEFVDLLIAALLSKGHVLIEGVPGIAKTETAKIFAKCVSAAFSRIQFTPDLMPSDVLGTSIFNEAKRDFEFKKGPIFSNLVLIDEINRSPAKTQSSLFEVMEEKQISIDQEVFKMQEPFMVLATQNPIEQEGTYALPEAQLDRFLFKIKLNYPSLEAEIKLLEKKHQNLNQDFSANVESVLNVEDLIEYRKLIQQVIVEPKILTYIAQLIQETRKHPHLILGASPRASIALLNTSKTFAAMQGRDFVSPEDVKRGLKPVLNHRMILSPEKEMEGITTEQVIDLISKTVEVPR
ncbi:AAA family ATPase [Psychroflexus maritimus]|uniref:MoxR family ATPase n=1 Tax=Psychroflexus maritimus TaxID=2714865 RepID=A0A967AEF9_9FLAO|nr:MoxR family ATPase [Psychroflexus maritimus]NGZ88996.1 MoxR family ATPase [Psychroflexus maritimus]